MAKKKAKSSSAVTSKWNDADVQIAQEALLEAVEEADVSDPYLAIPNLNALFATNSNSGRVLSTTTISSNSQKQLLLYSISKFEKALLRRFWRGLDQIVDLVLRTQAHVIGTQNERSYDDHETNDDNDEDSVPNDPQVKQALLFLKIAAGCLQSYIEALVVAGQVSQQQSKSSVVLPSPEAVQLAVRLHDTLFSLNTSSSNHQGHQQQQNSDAWETQQTIVTLCETWWLARIGGAATTATSTTQQQQQGKLLPHRDDLIVQTLPLLAVQALDQADAKSVKRLHRMRHALALIDFGDPTSDSLRHLLVRLVASPAVKLTHGRQLLSYLVVTDARLRSDIHQAIKVQLPDSKETMNDLYGDIYLRAWKDADVDTRPFIESDLLQDLVDLALHIQHPALHWSLLHVLHPIQHPLRKTSEGQALLYRIYGPVLWRSLRAANAVVRVHAVQLLAGVFPLAGQSSSIGGGSRTDDDLEGSIRKACQALRTALADADARVRTAAATATAHILVTFWNTVPAAEIRTLLNHIVAEHASDSTSAAVRAGALQAVTTLLEHCPDSHAVLRGLLPALGNLIHDKTDKVRQATAEMLLVLKELPNFKYYKVVPPDHLQARLAAEPNPTNNVAKLVTQLLASSYLPSNRPSSVQLARTLQVLEHAGAARVFYRNLHTCLPLEGVVKLAKLLWIYLQAAVAGTTRRIRNEESQTKRRRRRTSADDDDDESSLNEEGPTAEDTALMAMIAETIDILWESVEKPLAKDKELRATWMEAMQGSTLTYLLEYFEQVATTTKDPHCFHACASLLRLAGRMPSDTIEGLVTYISKALAVADTDAQNRSTHIALLCLWDMTDQVGPALAQSIQGGLEGDSLFDALPAEARRRASPRHLKLVVPDLLPRQALEIVQTLLRGADPSSATARQALFQNSMVSTEALEQALWLGTRQAERLLVGPSSYVDSVSEPEVDFILQVCEAYGRFILHKQGFNSNNSNSLSRQAETLLEWASEKVIPVLSAPADADAPFFDPNLSTIAADSTFTMGPLSPATNGPTRKRANRRRTPVRKGGGDRLSMASDVSAATPHRQSISKAVASSLLQSICLIFAEWLAVGGDGGASIAATVSPWCSMLAEQNLNEIQRGIFVASFSRLALQLATKSENFVLLKQLLLHAPSGREETNETLIERLLQTLTKSPGNAAEAVLSKTIETALDAARLLIDKNKAVKFGADAELPSSLAELWPSGDGSCVRAALAGIFSNKQAALCLAKCIVDDCNDHVDMSDQVVLFRVQCLWLLCDPEICLVAPQVCQLVDTIDAEAFEEENGLRQVLEDVQGLAQRSS